MHRTDIPIMKSVCITYIPVAFSRLLSDFYISLRICGLCKDSDNLSKIHGFRNKLQAPQVHVLKYSSLGDIPQSPCVTGGNLQASEAEGRLDQAPCTHRVHCTERTLHD